MRRRLKRIGIALAGCTVRQESSMNTVDRGAGKKRGLLLVRHEDPSK
jgi:hypothetical protein